MWSWLGLYGPPAAELHRLPSPPRPPLLSPQRWPPLEGVCMLRDRHGKKASIGEPTRRATTVYENGKSPPKNKPGQSQACVMDEAAAVTSSLHQAQWAGEPTYRPPRCKLLSVCVVIAAMAAATVAVAARPTEENSRHGDTAAMASLWMACRAIHTLRSYPNFGDRGGRAGNRPWTQRPHVAYKETKQQQLQQQWTSVLPGRLGSSREGNCSSSSGNGNSHYRMLAHIGSSARVLSCHNSKSLRRRSTFDGVTGKQPNRR
ncbi:hypothetical protein THASP1DRAFT_21631 [Thamnocephalis sphaerospora]|uniref:Uncharacterized protein n=1 Tax=Thamnocephalis sphaerospora TaxID=78915 RepID=A0A4P9XWP0_9FUNG|nr:hypothetical protein THASP1DRAFT_21631 [Thamnocephalis sphaerospora]|eukprot:RKP10717.1 hypothetical protein THASP1DRAFT_21631 [Thamnocephalis sphaerospora]